MQKIKFNLIQINNLNNLKYKIDGIIFVVVMVSKI